MKIEHRPPRKKKRLERGRKSSLPKLDFMYAYPYFVQYERMNIIGEIVVIDAPCGSGKTSWAIQYIKEHTEDSFVYCTPFLDEIERIRRACGKSRFREPNNYESTKIENFNELLAVGTDIAVTQRYCRNQRIDRAG